MFKSTKSSSKPQVAEKNAGSGGDETASTDEPDNTIQLSTTRYLTIAEFKNKVRVDIREYYFDRDSGERKPGKKGISLSLDEWKKIVENTEKIEKAVKEATGEKASE